MRNIPHEVELMVDKAITHFPHKRKRQVAVVMIHGTCANQIATALESLACDIRNKQTEIGVVGSAVGFGYSMTYSYVGRKRSRGE